MNRFNSIAPRSAVRSQSVHPVWENGAQIEFKIAPAISDNRGQAAPESGAKSSTEALSGRRSSVTEGMTARGKLPRQPAPCLADGSVQAADLEFARAKLSARARIRHR